MCGPRARFSSGLMDCRLSNPLQPRTASEQLAKFHPRGETDLSRADGGIDEMSAKFREAGEAVYVKSGR
jgi:hypothetical protein